MNEWQWYLDKLAGVAGDQTNMSESTPHAGFYRWPRKAHYGSRKTFLPVAYWPSGEDGQLNCRVGDNDISTQRGNDIWIFVGDNPVTEDAYRAVAERGEPWPDEHELVPMGDNMPPEDDSFEALRDSIELLAQEADRSIKGPPIQDQAEADRIANLADRLAELWKKADEQRKAERKPHDETIKGIQAKWSPLLVLAETYKNLKYKLLTPWLKARAEDAEREAEAAAAAGDPSAADARRPRAGTRGRAMTLKPTKYADITDFPKCLAFFKDSPDVRTTVQALANRAVRSGIEVPGTKVREDAKAV